MRYVSCVLTLCFSLLAVGSAAAQDFNALLKPGPKLPCPASGYYPPMYGVIGRNAGDGWAITEAVSPCTPQEVIDAADSVGMARAHFLSPLSVKSVVTAMFTAEGTFATDGKAPRQIEQLDFHIHYGLPGARLMIRNSGKLDIVAFNDELGWKEVSEGGAATPAMNRRRELEVLTKLTPFGALWSVIEAEGHTKVSKVDGKTVLRGTSPYDGIDVTVTLDAQNRPERVTAVDGKNTYGATFADYREDFEPVFYFIFPKRLTWTKNDRPYADLTVTAYKTNPYVVFPVPANIKRGAGK
jgi:hypothetical protein